MGKKAVRRVLTEAREILSDPRNWGSGEMIDRQGAVCLLGAINKAATGTAEPGGYGYYPFFGLGTRAAAIREVAEAVGVSPHGTELTDWNDHLHLEYEYDYDPQGHEKLLNVLDKAIEKVS